jgi:ribokinase
VKQKSSKIVILGIFVADLTFRTSRLPAWGETVLGSDFRVGPGGKGSNQAVCAARLGAEVSFISKLGGDVFGEMARSMFAQEGIDASMVFDAGDSPTGGASIVVEEKKGENAIVVVPGACNQLTTAEIDLAHDLIASSAIFMTQLELPVALVEHGLALARSLGVRTILNPAPALPVRDFVYPLCDYLTPNETEAAMLTGVAIDGIDAAEHAADVLLKRGAGNVVITLGNRGALVKNAQLTKHVPAINAGPVVETTGAGDAFSGALATGLAEGMDVVRATQFGCAVAGISVTRYGTAASMPRREEVNRFVSTKNIQLSKR